jgi:catechol 2,3-dioxygenase-like lactoylglutathione lyase family enzyme
MLGDAPFMAFIPVRDLTTAREFYESTLGLPVLEASPFAVAVATIGTVLRLTQVDELRVQPFTVAGWEVPDINGTVETLTSRGVTFTRYENMGQDDRGIWTTPGGDQVAWFTDPDGNTLSLTTFVGH